MPRIERLSTVGSYVRGAPPNHQNNVWLVGDDAEVLVVDPAHDVAAVLAAVSGRRVVAVVLTHGHWDHVREASEFAQLVAAPIFLSPEDYFLWDEETGAPRPRPLTDGQVFDVAGVRVRAFATPGHTPGSTSLRVDRLGAIIVGDTVFPGGPGATRWPYSDFQLIIDSIRTRIFVLPDETRVLPGHGEPTTVGAERDSLPEWIARGW